MPPSPQAQAGAAMLGASVLGGAAAASGGLAGLIGTRSPNATFLSILQSRTVQDDLIDRFKLRSVYGCKLYQDARKKLIKRTVLNDDRKTNVLEVTVTANTPELAQGLAAGYVDELKKLVVQMDTSTAHQERVFLEARLKDVKQSMDQATSQLSTFSSKNATMDMENQAKVTLDATAKLQGELIAAESQLQGLSAIYAPDNVRVKELQARITSLRGKMKNLEGTSGEESRDPEESDQPYPSLRQLPFLGATYVDLYRTAKIEETIFEILSKQYEIAKLNEAEAIPEVKVLDPPDYPEKKTFPPRTLIVILGTFFASICGAAWIMGLNILGQAENENPLKALIKRIQPSAM